MNPTIEFIGTLQQARFGGVKVYIKFRAKGLGYRVQGLWVGLVSQDLEP